jgi:hypothetical protein
VRGATPFLLAIADLTLSYIGNCVKDGTQRARPLGVIAIEMMENGLPPPNENKLALRNPEPWSKVAVNFITVADWGTLDDVKSVS